MLIEAGPTNDANNTVAAEKSTISAPPPVIPAKAGIQGAADAGGEMDPRVRGNDGGKGWLTPILLLIAALALAVPALLLLYAPSVPVVRHRPPLFARPHRTIPAAELPPVEPVRLVDVTPEDAQAINAAVPFVRGAVVRARAFAFLGGSEDRARATDCLAAAVIYEAGDDTGGERAVAQVILNRVRHPAYPKTVCGVVFQGSDRSTGCQFTFTCDGSIARRTPSPAAWTRARQVAAAALSGSVDGRVGLATHYHTDYVVPYWQSSLDKIAQIGTHLFYRWTGWWGTPRAFVSGGGAGEPGEYKLAALSGAHAGAPVPLDATDGAAPVETVAADVAVRPVPGDPNSFLVTLPAHTSPDAMPLLAMDACAERTQCRYSAWAEGARTPRALPLSAEQVATMTFSYLRDRPVGIEKRLWNCQQTRRSLPLECMKVQVLSPAPGRPAGLSGGPPAPELLPGAGYTQRGPADLSGVRRRPSGLVAPGVQAVDPAPTTAQP